MTVRGWALGLAGMACALGAAVFVTGWAKSKDAWLTAGSGVVVAGLALTGLAIGLSTWRDERAKAQEAKQRDTYGALVFHLMGRFSGLPQDAATEARLRAEVATWGSLTVVQRLQQWNATYDLHIPAHIGPGVTFALTPDATSAFRDATAGVVRAVRQEMPGVGNASVEEIRGALFNMPKPVDPTMTTAATTQNAPPPTAGPPGA